VLLLLLLLLLQPRGARAAAAVDAVRGSHLAAIGVELMARRGDVIHYTTDGTLPTRASPSARSGDLVQLSTVSATLRARCRRRPGLQRDGGELPH
jgi:hypothetical protein